MKHNKNIPITGVFLKALGPKRLRRGPLIAAVSSFIVCAIFINSSFMTSGSLAAELQDFEVGRVAEKDVVADYQLEYIDQEATKARKDAQEQQLPAVFRYSAESSEDVLTQYQAFSSLSEDLFQTESDWPLYLERVQNEFPGAFSETLLQSLYRNPSRERILEYCGEILSLIMNYGVYSLPASNLEAYNPEYVELLRAGGKRDSIELLAYSDILHAGNVSAEIQKMVSDGSYPGSMHTIAPALLAPFISENVFFSQEDTQARLELMKAAVEPVVREIEKGERIIRKGFLVTQEDMQRLQALGLSMAKSNPAKVIGQSLILLLVFALFVFLNSPRVVGRLLEPSEIYLLAVLTSAYVIGSLFAARAVQQLDYYPAAILLPTALTVMLPAVLMGPRVASALAMALPVASFISGAFDSAAFIFALASGFAGVYALQGTERRMDLIKAGFFISLCNIVAGTGILLLYQAPIQVFPGMFFWAAFNGMVCGMLVLGSLPLLEQALNTATPFRLIELSDLNSPVLKRLLTIAPGTYSHSVTVANLAESACREIGADSLLARVGAYYHDIGKMDQPDYFIENQAVYNKHEELAPRLSATVIRSHVKVGIEKGRKLGLPKQVLDIITEHHGNSVISWFYNEALKREDQVAAEDFAYPGSPPKSRESAVVMLADTVEAAVRTLKKPTMSRLEKFVQELIMSKFEQGQLSESELTFKDLETIKNAFVRVLAGHYHSRIEYPKAVRELLR